MAETREFPALPGWTEYETAVQRYRNLVAERRQHGDTLDALEHGEVEATKVDDDAQASAMLAGGKDPGRKHHTQWKRDLEAARTRARVLDAAVTQQGEAVMGLLRSQADKAAEAAQTAAEAAREAYAARLDGLLGARDAYWRARQITAWLADGLSVNRKYKPSGAPPSLQDPRQYGPGAVSPEPVSARRALAGFRLEVDPALDLSPVVGYRVQRSQDVRGADDMTGRRSAVDSVTLTAYPVDALGRRVPPDRVLNR